MDLAFPHPALDCGGGDGAERGCCGESKKITLGGDDVMFDCIKNLEILTVVPALVTERA